MKSAPNRTFGTTLFIMIVAGAVLTALFVNVIGTAQKGKAPVQISAPVQRVMTPPVATQSATTQTAAMPSVEKASPASLKVEPTVELNPDKPVGEAPLVTDRSTSVRGVIQQDAPIINNASNYSFTTATNGTFTDMSSGTTQLVAAGADDSASSVTNLGFDFFFQGTRYTQFSASSNGYVRLGSSAVSTTQYVLGTAATPLITAYGSDMIVSTSGKVHYKVTGSAPNRVLTVEFLNITIIYDGIGTSADGTYQVRLYEGTGVIEFVYGAMNRNTGTGFSGANNPQYCGFSLNSTDNTYATVTTSTNTVNTTTALASNQPTTGASIPNLNTPTNGSHRVYTFTPTIPTAPTGLNFTGVTPTAMTVNWTDSPDETVYAIYNSTDGTNYSFVNTAAQNATSLAVSGLSPNTTYFWKVFAVSDGALSAALAGSQATTAGGSISSTAVGGLWSVPATWTGGVVPTNTDNVTITDGSTVTIDTAAVALSVTVGTGGSAAILQYLATSAQSLTVGTSVTIASNGTFQSAATGTVTTHVLSVGTNLTNNGVLDFSTNANTAGAGITFTGAANNTFGGTGGTTDIRTLTINKGTSNANILELNPSNFTVQGTTTDGTPMAFLTLTNGTLKVSGTFTMTGRVFTAAGYTIGATAGFWLNNPNFTVAGQNGSPTESGLLRISQGTYNIGTSTGNSMGFSTGSTVTVEGGAVNATGRFGVAAAGNIITYTQSGGTITVCTVGNASTALASFDLGTSLSSAINMSGGTIVVQLASTAASGPRDYRDGAGGGISNVTGGTLQLGNAASGAAKSFNISNVAPNIVISNASAGHTVTFQAPASGSNYNDIALNVTISTGTTLNLTNAIFLMNGTTFTNNGTLTVNGASSNFVWFLTTAPQNYTGTGTVTAPVTNMAFQNDMGVTFNASSPNIVCTAIRLFNGSVTNSNKLTLGNGGSTTGTVQIGNTTTATNAGTFDQALTFNLGTGGEVISYLRTGSDRSTGPEINPARTLTTLNIDPNGTNVNLVGDLTITGTTTLTTGNFNIGANTLTITNALAGTPTFLFGGATSSMVINGTVASNVPSSITQLNNFTLNNTGGSTQQVTTFTVNGTFALSNGAYTIGARNLNLNGPITTTSGTLTGGNTSNVTIGGSGAQVTLPAVSGGLSSLTITRNGGCALGAPLSIASSGTPGLVLFNGTLNNSTNNVTLADLTFLRRDNGSITAAPIFTNRVDLAYFSGSTGTSGPEMPTSSSAIHILESNWANLTLSANATVNLQLILDAGTISTGGNVLTLNTGATVARTSGWVNGNYARVFQSNAPFTYDVGDTLNYSPVLVTPSAGSYPTTLTVRATAAPLAGLVSVQSLQRQWSFSSSGITRATLDLSYVPADIGGAADVSQWRVVRKIATDERFTFPNGLIDNVNEGTMIGTASNITMPAFGGTYTISQTNAPAGRAGDPRPVETFDYRGNDSRTDVSVWDGTSGVWTFINSANGTQTSSNPWGSTALGDHIVPGDYDGDSLPDLAVWRDTDFNWFIIKSSTGLGQAINWGASGDKTVPGDYDGDGKTDVAVFRPSEGNWYILRSSDNGVVVRNWGAASDYLVPADYDGDGKTDIAVFRPSEGNWYVVKSSDSSVVIRSWGTAGDSIVPGDYDGDGKADFAIFRPSDGAWYVINSADSSVTIRHWGAGTDTLVPGDYDRDGRIDLAVYRPSEGNWYIINSGDGTLTLRNLSGGTIVPAAYVQP